MDFQDFSSDNKYSGRKVGFQDLSSNLNFSLEPISQSARVHQHSYSNQLSDMSTKQLQHIAMSKQQDNYLNDMSKSFRSVPQSLQNNYNDTTAAAEVIKTYQIKVKSMSEELENTRNELSIYQQRSQREYQDYQEQIMRLTQLHQQEQNELQNNLRIMQSINLQENDQRKKGQQLESIISRLKNQIENESKDKMVAQKQLETLQAEHQKIMLENQLIKQKLNRREQELLREIQELKEINSQLQLEMESLKQDKELLAKSLLNEQSQSQRIAFETDKIKNVQNLYKDLHNKTVFLQNNMIQQKQSYFQTLSQLQLQNKELQAKNRNLNSLVQQQRQKLAALKRSSSVNASKMSTPYTVQPIDLSVSTSPLFSSVIPKRNKKFSQRNSDQKSLLSSKSFSNLQDYQYQPLISTKADQIKFIESQLNIKNAEYKQVIEDSKNSQDLNTTRVALNQLSKDMNELSQQLYELKRYNANN